MRVRHELSDEATDQLARLVERADNLTAACVLLAACALLAVVLLAGKR